MGGIPLLNDRQMNVLRRLLGENQKFNLSVVPRGKIRKLPSYDDDDIATESSAVKDVVLAKVLSGNSTMGYRVALYANGRDSASTGTGIVFLPEVALTGTLPVGTWLLAHLSDSAITGGND